MIDKQIITGGGQRVRLPWIDWAKSICMFCVVLTHTGCFGREIVLNYFDMPAFLMISGYLYKRVPFKEEIRKSFRGIVIPYLILNSIILVVSLFFYSFQWSDILNLLLGNQEGLRWNCFFPMWFLVSIFIIRIICSFFNEKTYLWLMLVMVAVGYWVWSFAPYDYDYFQICTTAMCLPFFLFGTVLKRFDGFILLNKIKPILRYALICILLVLLYYLLRYNGFANIFRCVTGKNPLLYYLAGISFSYLVLYLISKVFTKSWAVVLTISSGTVLILGLHRIFIEGLIFSLPRNSYIAIATAFLVMLICYPLILFAQKYFPAIVGGRGVKKQKVNN